MMKIPSVEDVIAMAHRHSKRRLKGYRQTKLKEFE